MSSPQAYFTLCLAALAVAAPQQNLGDLRSVEITRNGVDREKVLSQVVAALTPQIQTAVAQALAALQTQAPKLSSKNTNSGSGLSTITDAGLSSAAGPGLSSTKGLGISSNVGSGLSSKDIPGLSHNVASDKSSNGAGSMTLPDSGPKSNNNAVLSSTLPGSQTSVTESGASPSMFQANSELDTSAINDAQSLTGQASSPTSKPVYNFEYKVASEADQTYLSQNEERDGDHLTGSYKYVNPLGALITVNYQAGPEGFSQTIGQQDEFIVIRPKPLNPLTSAPSSSSLDSAKSDSDKSKYLPTGFKLSSDTQSGSPGSETSVKSSESNAPGSEIIVPSSERDASKLSSKAEPSSTFNQQELINSIISSLQPEITAAVKAALDKTKADNPVLSRPANSKTKTILQDASAVKLNSIDESVGKLNTRLPEHKGTATEISQNFTPGIRGRYRGAISLSTNSVKKPGVDRDMVSKFGSGLYVNIKTPHSEISY